MSLSYWEIKSWYTNVDFTVIGSGIVGLSCALRLKEKYPKASILVLEKGSLPQGASTKNAGFACFGSLSELINDLKTHTEEEVLELVTKRVEGLKLLRNTLGDATINYQQNGGYELFLSEQKDLFEECLEGQDQVNLLLREVFREDVFSFQKDAFNFQNVQSVYNVNQFEGQLDTGMMMQALLNKAFGSGIKVLNNVVVKKFDETGDSIHVNTDHFDFSTSKLFIATNGFARQLIEENIKPARAQVLITKPIQDLHIKGTFHLDQGYYYFRNIDNRILFGGGRNLDFETEETTQFGKTSIIQEKLEELLRTTILPNTDFEIDHRWSGIMGVGSHKKAIVKQVSNNAYCGVRLGGMGVAIGSLIGKELAELL